MARNDDCVDAWRLPDDLDARLQALSVPLHGLQQVRDRHKETPPGTAPRTSASSWGSRSSAAATLVTEVVSHTNARSAYAAHLCCLPSVNLRQMRHLKPRAEGSSKSCMTSQGTHTGPHTCRQMPKSRNLWHLLQLMRFTISSSPTFKIGKTVVR